MIKIHETHFSTRGNLISWEEPGGQDSAIHRVPFTTIHRFSGRSTNSQGGLVIEHESWYPWSLQHKHKVYLHWFRSHIENIERLTLWLFGKEIRLRERRW